MNHNQEIRYSRNISLREIGINGQEKLLRAKVLVIGAGGIGSPALLYLTAAGIGEIGIVDNDKVDLSNLQRQILHEAIDINVEKTESAEAALLDLNPDIKINCHQLKIEEDNAAKIIADYDIVLDGCDNFETRFIVSDVCHKLKKPLISASIEGWSGQMSAYKPYLEGDYPCYRCVYDSSLSRDDMPKCSESGVLGAAAGVMGSIAATEIIKEIVDVGDSMVGYMLVFDAFSMDMRKVKIARDKNCSCVGKSKF